MKEKYTSCAEIPSMKMESLKVPERGGNKYSNRFAQMGIWLESKIRTQIPQTREKRDKHEG